MTKANVTRRKRTANNRITDESSFTGSEHAVAGHFDVVDHLRFVAGRIPAFGNDEFLSVLMFGRSRQSLRANIEIEIINKSKNKTFNLIEINT